MVTVERHPEQEVREGKIREELPLGDDQLQVVDGGAGELRVLSQQVRERAQNSSMSHWGLK
jgi:hypothetical protein